MQYVPCPSCGAQIKFRSHASVMAVCEYCKTTVLKDQDSVKALGTMSEVLEDYSPIQIGTSGVYKGQGFSVIGRIQLRYSAGLWNEWYLMFEDGQAAWLGDSSGLYTLTYEQNATQVLPAWEDLQPAGAHRVNDRDYIVAEVRLAECMGGQGELPFRVGGGWRARVADLRSEGDFVTLDYSDSNIPKVYAGVAVTPDLLKCQLLRGQDQIQASAGKYKGKIDRLDCPSCGSSIRYVPGATTHLICSSCSAQVDTTGSKATVLAAGERIAHEQTTLELGVQAPLSGMGMSYELIGLMKRKDEEGTVWTEYLFHNTRSGFVWLIETNDGWARAQVKPHWPIWSPGGSAILGTQAFAPESNYSAEVIYAVGAFNWQVRVGDRTQVIEFKHGNDSLAAEITNEEMTWSLSSPIPGDQIHAWFGAHINVGHSTKLGNVSQKFIIAFLLLNSIPLLLEFEHTWLTVLFALVALYAPAKFLDSLNEGSG